MNASFLLRLAGLALIAGLGFGLIFIHQENRKIRHLIVDEQLHRIYHETELRAPGKPNEIFPMRLGASGWQVVVSADKSGTYPEMERALSQALDEVRHRIDNGHQLF